MTQRRGKAPRSVEMNEVTPIRRLDGTAAYRSHRMRSRAVTGAAPLVPSSSWWFTTGKRDTLHAIADTPRTTPAYNSDQPSLWFVSVRRGSIRKGYDRSASRLPRLLAAYRK